MSCLDSDWNPHADLQAMARAHRLGQQNKVKSSLRNISLGLPMLLLSFFWYKNEEIVDATFRHFQLK